MTIEILTAALDGIRLRATGDLSGWRRSTILRLLDAVEALQASEVDLAQQLAEVGDENVQLTRRITALGAQLDAALADATAAHLASHARDAEVIDLRIMSAALMDALEETTECLAALESPSGTHGHAVVLRTRALLATARGKTL